MHPTTLRDKFAIHIAAALITKTPLYAESDGCLGKATINSEQGDAIRKSIAISAYKYADALIAARKRNAN